MALTLREALEFDLFKRSEPEIVAGWESLDRPLRWVHISELADVGKLIKGGELILTTGMGLDGLPGPELRRFVDDLAAALAAGIVVELGRTFTEPPADLVDAARQAAMPLVLLHRPMHYVEATELLLSIIVNRKYEALQRAETISRDFTSLLLRGAGLKRILERLAQGVGNPVILEDGAHQLVEFARGGEAPIEAALAGWAQHSRTGHQGEDPERVHDATTRQRCLWIGIWLREELWGRLHVLQLNRPLDEVDRLALDRAAAAVGMALLQEKDRAQLSEGARRSLLWDIRHGNHCSATEIIERARALRADLAGSPLAVVIMRPRGFEALARSLNLSEWGRQRLRQRILDATRAAMTRGQRVSVSAIEGDQIVVVAAVPDADGDKQLQQIMVDAGTRIEEETEGLVAVVGISDTTNVEALRRAFGQAEEALALGMRDGAERRIYRYADLGVHHLLARLAEGPELATFVESKLHPLLDDGAKRVTPLLHTLRVYLESGGNKTKVAHTLHIERRSLYHRLDRLEQILQRPLDDPDTQLELRLALTGLDVLQSATADARPVPAP